MYDTTEAFLLLCFTRLLSFSNSPYLLKTIPYLGFHKAQGGSMGNHTDSEDGCGLRLPQSADFVY